MNRLARALVAGLACLAISACETKPPPAAPPPPAEVVVSRPLVEEVTESVEATGTTAPLAAVDVRARVTGFLESMLVAPRSLVEPNQPLFTIDRRPFELRLRSAEAEADSRRAQLAKAEFDAEKISELYKRGSASLDELTRETTTRDALRAAVAAADATVAEAALQLEWCTVVAPVAGRISRNLVDVGNIVAADTTVLANIVDDSQVLVYFHVSEQDTLALRQRVRTQRIEAGEPPDVAGDLRTLRHPVYIGLMTEDGYPHAGIFDYAAPALDPTTGTQQVRAVFDNADGQLLAGLFCRVRVPIAAPAPARMVAERALGLDQGQRYVLVVDDQNVVHYRPVQVGPLRGQLRVVRSGLSADDRVIVNGIQRVRPGVTVKPVEVPMQRDAPATTRAASSPTTAPAPSVSAAPPPSAP